MVTYRANEIAIEHARKLIDAGTYRHHDGVVQRGADRGQENKVDEATATRLRRVALGVDPEASEDTKGRYAFPYGDFSRVNRVALIHAKQRAAQNDHDEVDKAADDLLQRLDDKRS